MERVPLLRLFLGGLCTITLGIYTYFLVISLIPAHEALMPSTWLVVSSQELNLREGPDTNSPILKKLELGQRIEMLSEQDNWFKVKDDQGQNGWVFRANVVYSPPGLQ